MHLLDKERNCIRFGSTPTKKLYIQSSHCIRLYGLRKVKKWRVLFSLVNCYDLFRIDGFIINDWDFRTVYTRVGKIPECGEPDRRKRKSKSTYSQTIGKSITNWPQRLRRNIIRTKAWLNFVNPHCFWVIIVWRTENPQWTVFSN